MPAIADWIQGPEWAVAVTVAAYAAALLLRNKFKWMHPLFTGAAAVILFLTFTDISYEDYRIGGDLILFMLGPATVALGVPLYKHSQRLRRHIPGILAGVMAGSVVSIAGAWLLASVSGLSTAILYSMIPKSVTAAVSVPLSEQLGGIPELTAVLTVLTGLIGSMFGPMVLKLFGIRRDLAIGVAVGTASHGIGTARLVNDSEWQASVSALSMSLSCIITPIFILPLYWLI
ncbi:LrgB family protein [Paenibacillus abyssi]|uniref:LrgB family protein n=1 Tax=Paenibacillus abyssi TaxID=1340531 RepID=A0A917CFC2_9BACL|nr:LrgB family protein [Paenibacillus abyssi]GGF86712.1 LrgB family protein [Paenibacillus abyssi]